METGNRDDLLTLEDVRCHFPVRQGMLGEVRHLRAVDGVDLVLRPGQSLGLVGESGCGKSTLGRLVCGLQRPTGGRILFRGAPLPPAGAGSMAAGRIQMVFQDPFSSLDPRCTVGTSVEESLLAGERLSRRERRERVRDMFATVGLAGLERRYPHEFSGGMRQRVVIAIAVACSPKILICDEPTTALDVTIQAQILQLLKEMRFKYDLTIVMITHDLGVVANIADRVAVMYAGDIVEIGTADEIYYDPRHPYTWALLSSMPQMGVKGEDLFNIVGTPPNLFAEIRGDAFAPRNPQALKIDFVKRPPYFEVTPTHKAKTWLLDPRAPKIEPPAAVKMLREEGL